MASTTMVTYRIEFVDGWSATGHFGREIAAELGDKDYQTLAEARAVLRTTKADHRRRNGSAEGYNSDRFDIVASNGRRWSWQ